MYVPTENVHSRFKKIAQSVNDNQSRDRCPSVDNRRYRPQYLAIFRRSVKEVRAFIRVPNLRTFKEADDEQVLDSSRTRTYLYYATFARNMNIIKESALINPLSAVTISARRRRRPRLV